MKRACFEADKMCLRGNKNSVPYKVVMTACMHKLLTILNAMAKATQPWQAAA